MDQVLRVESLHTEMWLGKQTESIQNVGGAKVYRNSLNSCVYLYHAYSCESSEHA